MNTLTPTFVVLVWAAAIGTTQAQTTQTPAPTASQTVLEMIGSVEKSITGVATEMPEDKYGFAPTAGAFRGVRNFAAQIKHAAAVQHLIAASLLGDPITADMSDERGPDSVKTKADVLKYLADSFAHLKKAAATVDDKRSCRSRVCSGQPRRRELGSSCWLCRTRRITTDKWSNTYE
jgi:DinB superfamily